MRRGALLLLVPAVAWAGGFHWDVPKQIESVRMDGTLSASGIPVRLQAAVSALDYHALETHYAKAFAAAGLYVAPPKEQQSPTRYPELTALDVDRHISYTVILQPDANGHTTVIMGEADLGPAPIQATTFAPLYPGADQVTRMRTGETASVLFSAPAAAPDIDRYYVKALAGVGYRQEAEPQLAPDAGSDPTGAQAKLFVRKGEWIRVSIRAGAEAADRQWVLLEHGLGPPPGTADLR